MGFKFPYTLKDEARDECYEYFDKNIRELKKDSNGKVDPAADGLQNNDVDAFRHVYVSGVMTQEYSESTADILGQLNEYHPFDLYSNSNDPRSLNMDLWNNAVGRKYGKKAKTGEELLKMIHEALKNGELITDLSDTRKYLGDTHDPSNKSKPVIVLEESEKGRNEVFFDLITKEAFSRDEFIAKIESGIYKGYTVKNIKGVPTPVSLPDKRDTNNLG